MEHYTEQELDQRARQGSGETDDHISVCPLCRERYAFAVRFHAALVKEEGCASDPRIEQLIGRLSGKNVILLHPYASRPDLSQFGVSGGVVVLAAQTEATEQERVVTAATFASEQDHVVLRVMHDRNANKYLLYLLTPNPEMARNAVLGIGTPDGRQVAAKTDATGVATVEDAESIDWAGAVIAIEPHL